MSKEAHPGLIWKLYNALKEEKVYSSQKSFCGELLEIPCDSNDDGARQLIHNDYYNGNWKNKMQELLSEKGNDKNSYIVRIHQRLISLNNKALDNIYDSLLESLESKTYYTSKTSRDGDHIKPSKSKTYFTYSEDDIKQLRTYIQISKSFRDIGYSIYVLLYLSNYKRLPDRFYFGLTFQQDLMEFNNEVTIKYGALSKPGVRAIINLAKRGGDDSDTNEKPNIIASYEYADMLYYGSKYGPSRNIEQAIEEYEKIAIDKLNSRCHPLACWSLAYIYWKCVNIDYRKSIPKFKDIDTLFFVEKAIAYAQKAYVFLESPQAANILGKISILTEEELPGIDAIKNKYNLESSKAYYSFAANKDYIYAHTSLAGIYFREMLSATDANTVLAKLTESLVELDKVAKQFDPWSANWLGRFYTSGLNHDLLKSFIPTISNKYHLPDTKKYINRKLAYEYFQLAIKEYNDEYSGWAYANLIINYPQEYLSEDNDEKLVSHISKMKEINNTSAIEYLRKNFEGSYKIYGEVGLKTIERIATLLNIKD